MSPGRASSRGISKEAKARRGSKEGDSEKKRPASTARDARRPNSAKTLGNPAASTSSLSSKRLKSSSDNLKAPPAAAHSESATRSGVKRPARANGAAKATAPVVDAQSTQTQNGISKPYKKCDAEEEGEDGVPFTEASLDACAAVLASIDRRSYTRAILQDANAILSKIVFPMSFPWTHCIQPVIKSIPRDIDEVFGIRSVGNEIIEIMDEGSFGQFHSLQEHEGQSLLPNTAYAAARRSNGDPGVIEVTTIFPPTVARTLSPVSFCPLNNSFDDPHIPGELSLRAHEEVQEKKRQRSSLNCTGMKTTSVSFRVGSTSSRSTIFDEPLEDGKSLIQLEAILPAFVQDGSKLRGSQTHKIDRTLGSYDCGERAERTSDDRVKTGRIRLVWSSGPTNRSYKSLLTGKQLESGSHKRPRKVSVSVRINGELMSTSECPGLPIGEYSDDIVEEAIQSCGAKAMRSPVYQQCYLDREAYLTNLMQGRFESQKSDQLLEIQKQFSITLVTESIPLPALSVVPPQIDCMVCEDGRVVTTCTTRGRLFTSTLPTAIKQVSSNSKSPIRSSPKAKATEDLGSVSSLCSFLDLTAIDRDICSICWSRKESTSQLGLLSLLKCGGCGVPVHRVCYGRPIQGNDFKCDACIDLDQKQPLVRESVASRQDTYRRHRWDIQCYLCQEKGGTVTRQEDETFVHDICQIWGQSSIHKDLCCSLCNKKSTPVIQCMAENCQVMFHPICARLISCASVWKRQNSKQADTLTELEQTIEHDEFLCTQFVLSKLEVGTTATGDKMTVPAGFCGYHNPHRRADLYGFYPGGKFLQDAMRVPPLRTPVSGNEEAYNAAASDNGED